ncbi:hypothetical protein ABB37_01483 [Leptomonas pyrrhocoris]|uniref:PH domain-containing protein n=1 Tax=Leptomonas pyrrhocoris TaxID=157538 RepID=A0A0M9G929_LEPPY|nr:hypothetical protein ABB37_01483 [Leptomonas pyrrhocoris]KPA85066.1 hypothetical protein ABB37_01483 [Leptomonas pyrrhocoris]|eukprot:XP_015663505.1 hypothetical protein ABB37_01483 [Leptomonas pyrrhocoris]
MPVSSSRSHRDVSVHSLRTFNDGDGGNAATSLTRLEAHAAVRLDPLQGKTFDCYGLPLRRPGKDQRVRFSFIKSMKGLASYLTTRINPSFQECLICVVETESDVRFEVRQISNGKGTRARVLFSASLSALVDVARDSVIEKDTVVFSQLPSSFQPADDGARTPAVSSEAAADRRRTGVTSTTSPHHSQQQQRQPSRSPTPNHHHHHSKRAASKKEELISTLFSAYGDIGLTLVFHDARSDEDRLTHHRHRSSSFPSASHGGGSSGGSSSRPYTRIGLRFVSTVERNEWLSFCGEAYMGLLLDSIRTNRDTVYIPDDHSSGARAAAPSTVNGSDTFHLAKPPDEAVENYIDFFLSARTKADGNTNSNNHHNDSGGEADPLLVPFSGALRIRSSDGSLHTREVHLEKEDAADDAGARVTRTFLVFRRKGWCGKSNSQRVPLEGLQIYADDDQSGTSFYLEFAYSGKSAAEYNRSSHADLTAAAKQLYVLGAVQEPFLCGTDLADAQATVTLECEAGSFAARRQWLQWLEIVLKKQVVYLSVARRNAEAQKPVEQDTRNGLLGDRIVW